MKTAKKERAKGTHRRMKRVIHGGISIRRRRIHVKIQENIHFYNKNKKDFAQNWVIIEKRVIYKEKK